MLAICCIASANNFKSGDGKEYTPFLENDKQWFVWQFSSEHYLSSAAEYEQPLGNVYKTQQLNDTVIQGKSYTCMRSCSSNKCFNWNDKQSAFMYVSFPHSTLSVCGLFREENGKIYKYDEGTQTEYLFYDFTLDVGDEFKLFIPETCETVQCKVTDIDQATSCNQTHRRLHLSTDNPNFKETVWVEGFGSEAGPLVSMIRKDKSVYGVSNLSHARSQLHRYAQTFNDIHYRGQELHVNPEPVEYSPELKGLDFQFTEDVLHITGYMRLSGNPSNKYIYCADTEDGVLRLGVETMDDYVTTEQKIYGGIDLYFPGLKPGLYYVLTPSGDKIECKLSAEAISTTNNDLPNTESAIFTLQGTRLSHPQPGLNIINGKKVFIP